MLYYCNQACLFSPAIYLYIQEKHYDNTVKVIMDHVTAYSNGLFFDIIVKEQITEIIYKAKQFYLNMHQILGSTCGKGRMPPP